MNKVFRLLSLLILLPSLVLAEQGDLPIRTPGFLVGGGIGLSQVELNSDIGDIDGGEFSYKLFLGYRFRSLFMPWNSNLGVEAAFVELGTRHGVLDSSNWKMTNKGFSTSLVSYWPISRHWDLIGKAGAYFSDTELNNEDLDIPSGSKSSTDLALGVGVLYQSAGGLGGRFELESLGAVDGALLATFTATYQFK